MCEIISLKNKALEMMETTNPDNQKLRKHLLQVWDFLDAIDSGFITETPVKNEFTHTELMKLYEYNKQEILQKLS